MLRYADGELPAGKAAQIRGHLEACWQCRAELQAIEGIVGRCVEYREDVLRAHLPAPPKPWPDIYRSFAEMDAAGENSLRSRVRRALSFRPVPAFAAAVLALVVIYELGHAPSVQASELLRKAAAAADARPRKAHRVRIRTSRNQATAIIASERRLAAPREFLPARAMLQTAQYNWDDPLSARSYREWHDRLPRKRDEVTIANDLYSIRTTTPVGELSQASLKLRTQDLEPVATRLEFRNREWVEFTDLGEAPEPAPAETLPPPVHAAAGAHHAATPEAASQETPATLGDEILVLAALNHVGADLGDPVEVRRENGRVLVSGVGVAPERERQIRSAVEGMPKVVVQFAEPAEGEIAAAQPPPPPIGGASAGTQPWQSRIESQAGGRAEFERLSAGLLDVSDGMMARVYALRRLAVRFPPVVESQMRPEERRMLRDLVREHATLLAQQIAEIERQLRPVLDGLGASQSSARAPALVSGQWQPATEEIFRPARQVETQLAQLLGMAPAAGAGDALPSDLLTALAQLRAGAETYVSLSPSGVRAGEK